MTAAWRDTTLWGVTIPLYKIRAARFLPFLPEVVVPISQSPGTDLKLSNCILCMQWRGDFILVLSIFRRCGSLTWHEFCLFNLNWRTSTCKWGGILCLTSPLFSAGRGEKERRLRNVSSHLSHLNNSHWFTAFRFERMKELLAWMILSTRFLCYWTFLGIYHLYLCMLDDSSSYITRYKCHRTFLGIYHLHLRMLLGIS